MTKELLFSITAKDCDFQYVKSSGPGGQNVNKRSTKVRCTHIESGAVGESDETRHQSQNKVKAFRKMAESDTFKKWHKIECARRMGMITDVNAIVDKALDEKNIKTETKVEGKWTKTDLSQLTDE